MRADVGCPPSIPEENHEGGKMLTQKKVKTKRKYFVLMERTRLQIVSADVEATSHRQARTIAEARAFYSGELGDDDQNQTISVKVLETHLEGWY